ncbi:hypothetical protein A7U60_g7493 [Sanghuangporus baumii]|uniref:Uncharacterized protein n=1 Tax=Sanghuangporus baumii TaxID=108892 RepID=A0A9Q5HT35_SANBA|nr:hypothetical protein A7U60_g7493 [Sanghuangporus baumii]
MKKFYCGEKQHVWCYVIAQILVIGTQSGTLASFTSTIFTRPVGIPFSGRMRKANQKYSGRNGFDEATKRLPTESLKEPEATENQDLARFAEMKQEVKASDAPETVATLTERIKRSKRDNQEDVAKLSRCYAQGLYDDAMDRYCQTDDIKYHDFEDFARSSSDEWAQHYATLENYFRQYDKIAAPEHNDLVGRMQYDHLREVLPLYARRREAEKKEEMARLIQAAAKETHFPQSIKEYRMMDGRKDAQQQLIARFLMASEPNQGVLRTRCRWTRMQTEPLINEYKNDVSTTILHHDLNFCLSV